MSSHAPTLSPAAKANIPTHIAIIMDGNGRWAKRRQLPRIAGHRAGVENVRVIVKYCAEQGIETLTLATISDLITDEQNTERISDEELRIGVDRMMQVACDVATA